VPVAAGASRDFDQYLGMYSEPIHRYTVDLVERARADALDPVIGREAEIRRTLQILGRRTKNNPVLVGPPGVGKTAIVEGIAGRIAAGRVPESMKGRRLLALDLPQLLAGTRYRGDFEERLKSVVEAIVAATDVILFIDEVHTIVGAGDREGGIDAGDMLKPVLARGKLTCIGATTIAEYETHLGRDKALLRRFQPVSVKEPSVEDAIVILRGIKDRYEVHHRIRISDAAVVAAVQIASAHITDRFLPDKAIDLVDEAASQLKLEAESVPADVAAAEEALLRLEIEHRAIQDEDTPGGRHRRQWVVLELERLRAETDALRQRWEAQRETVAMIRSLIQSEDALRVEEDQARRHGHLARAGEIAYRALPALSQRIEALEAELQSSQAAGSMLRNQVTARDVGLIAASWTGKPLELLLGASPAEPTA
jgi:ATP-dependent Clp protease ATP-binding subunit ClpB